MVEYSLNLTNKNTNQPSRYTLELEKYYENNPASFFTPIICNNIRNELQTQSNCYINDVYLQIIIKTWIQDIKEGYRDSHIILDLPKINYRQISSFPELGNQELPQLIAPDLSNIEPTIGALPPLDFS